MIKELVKTHFACFPALFNRAGDLKPPYEPFIATVINSVYNKQYTFSIQTPANPRSEKRLLNFCNDIGLTKYFVEIEENERCLKLTFKIHHQCKIALCANRVIQGVLKKNEKL